jgi:hypothetical protein
MNNEETSRADSRPQQPDISPDVGSAVLVAKPASCGTGLTAERITSALLLAICIAAAVFV